MKKITKILPALCYQQTFDLSKLSFQTSKLIFCLYLEVNLRGKFVIKNITSPEPLHCGHFMYVDPGSARFPLHLEQVDFIRIFTSLLIPDTASANDRFRT